jgi:DNA-binding CsgD family transcriptional regulator
VNRFASDEPSSLPDAGQLGLTERQSQVLARLAQGKPNKVICRELDLAIGTVKIHVSAVLRALKVTNRTQAAIAARALMSGVVHASNPRPAHVSQVQAPEPVESPSAPAGWNQIRPTA